MRRDMDLVRAILAEVRSWPDLASREISIEGYSDELVGGHVQMLYDAGYLRGSGGNFGGRNYMTVLVQDLTWDGHEFYGAMATDEDTWQKVKRAFGPEKLATAPLKMIESVATAALTAWATKQLGL